jgi:hypothetical protein
MIPDEWIDAAAELHATIDTAMGGPGWVPSFMASAPEVVAMFREGAPATTAAAASGPSAGRPTIIIPYYVDPTDLVDEHSDVWRGWRPQVRAECARRTSAAVCYQSLLGHFVQARAVRKYCAHVRRGLARATAYQNTHGGAPADVPGADDVAAHCAFLENAVRSVTRQAEVHNVADGGVQDVDLLIPACVPHAEIAEAKAMLALALKEVERAAKSDPPTDLAYSDLPWSKAVPGAPMFQAADHVLGDAKADPETASSSTDEITGMETCVVYAPRLRAPDLNARPFVDVAARVRIRFLVPDRRLAESGVAEIGAAEVDRWDGANWVRSRANSIVKDSGQQSLWPRSRSLAAPGFPDGDQRARPPFLWGARVGLAILAGGHPRPREAPRPLSRVVRRGRRALSEAPRVAETPIWAPSRTR